VPYLSALEVCSRRGAIQIHVYLYLNLPFSKVINTRRLVKWPAGRVGHGSGPSGVGLDCVDWVRSCHGFSVVRSGQICRPITVNSCRNLHHIFVTFECNKLRRDFLRCNIDVRTANESLACKVYKSVWETCRVFAFRK